MWSLHVELASDIRLKTTGKEQMRILVIDDEVSARDVIVDLLTAVGHDVVEAKDGVEGLRLNSAEPADLVITDLFMPEKDGIAVVMELKRTMPDVKIITISGGGHYGNLGPLQTAKLLGSTFILEKPFTPYELLNLVEKAFGQDPTEN
jgi:CheY-like chemotaxis protein